MKSQSFKGMSRRLLTEFNAMFLDAGGPGVYLADGSPAPRRRGVGIALDCPCGCENGLYVPFLVPLDGGTPIETKGWQRAGDTLSTLTLRPSILRIGGCGWHGFITNGYVETC